MPVQMTGIAWYHESDYDYLRSKFDDGTSLPDTYAEWFIKANELLEKLRTEKVEVVKVYLTPDRFFTWCQTRKLKLDSKARMAYANEGAMNEWNKSNI